MFKKMFVPTRNLFVLGLSAVIASASHGAMITFFAEQ